MFNLIIVDDEVSTIEFLKNYITDFVNDFNVVGCFQDGEEAVDYLKDHNVDVVLSDIRMPKMSGIEVAEYIYNNHPQIKVVLISAYGEFEYARKAIEYNVFHYLLKAIDVNELCDVLNNVKNLLVTSKMDIILDDDNIQSKREEFFLDLIVGIHSNKEEIRKKFEQLDCKVNGNMAGTSLNLLW